LVPVKNIIAPPITQRNATATRFNYIKYDEKYADRHNDELECYKMSSDSITWIIDSLTDEDTDE
jgi:hypothetical protein